jgi:predicted dehydrogenase
MRVAIVGCGNIAERYATRIAEEESLTLVGAVDAVAARAEDLARAFDIRQYKSLEELLGDDDVDLVVNLTSPDAHAAVTAAALEAGKHVHTEKPVALTYDEARWLADLAGRTGRRLSCAPATLLGEAQQTAWKLVREGALGTVRVVYAEANWGRIESWHPSPQALYAVGPLVDVGVYPLTILTAMFGPVRRVSAFGATVQPDRVTLGGETFRPAAPDFVVSLLELDGGVVVRLTSTFWVLHGRQRGIEFHGEDGTALHLDTFLDCDSRLALTRDGGETYEPVPLVREPFEGIDWARAVVDLASAVVEGRSHRAGADQAAHVVEVTEAVARSRQVGGPVEVRSAFEPPKPLDWAL